MDILYFQIELKNKTKNLSNLINHKSKNLQNVLSICIEK